jgi:signal transduction histidine kinase
VFSSLSIELFYLFFQGMLLFQSFFLAILYFITKRKDILNYSIFLLLSALYFFLNAPNTFFGMDDDSIFNSALYRYGNIPLIIITNLFYVLFLKVFFAGIYVNKILDKLFELIFILTPVLMVVFFLLRFLEKDTQVIFYIVNLLAAGVSIFIVSAVWRKRLPNTSWVAWGMVFNILGTTVTILMIVLERYGVRNLITLGYPLLFMRIGILADMFFYQVALLKKWHYQEKQLAIEKLHSQLEVEKLRNKISGELHDDIGSTLSGIAMYSHMTEGQLQSGDYNRARDSVNIIQRSANEIVEKLGDMVWAIDPVKDSLNTMLERIKKYGDEMCRAKNIHFDCSFENIELIHEPGMNIRQHVYLLAKEAINNSVKYSGGTVIQFSMSFTNGSLGMMIKDNGNGFDIATVQKGNGLDNMKRRAADAGAVFELTSAPARGTSIMLRLKIPQ